MLNDEGHDRRHDGGASEHVSSRDVLGTLPVVDLTHRISRHIASSRRGLPAFVPLQAQSRGA